MEIARDYPGLYYSIREGDENKIAGEGNSVRCKTLYSGYLR
jgi:hypothetical protein